MLTAETKNSGFALVNGQLAIGKDCSYSDTPHNLPVAYCLLPIKWFLNVPLTIFFT
jgi:hypothetical protein